MPNLISTAGAFLFALGVALFVVDVFRRFRFGQRAVENPWAAPTLEWLPGGSYSTRSIPEVTSREPLWDQPRLSKQVAAGGWYLPDAPTGGRETLVVEKPEPKKAGAGMPGGMGGGMGDMDF